MVWTFQITAKKVISSPDFLFPRLNSKTLEHSDARAFFFVNVNTRGVNHHAKYGHGPA
ncbi:hypothetical protein RB296 [Rhodopirellula baltica SH 1]|uniref:Uncharacterized protein n=1 Tax=Rhodopirellula baltica (strain DSM 10527 / NCIMB 13988 / SH1) TaxID=243090 RepID=Q7UYZ4_RHOBA|nr:hypothetical protein RB296 [Rhodopirellula baltica SH 1]